jgi:alkylation response protein AidB-like acyl-CoA dehydrogenase
MAKMFASEVAQSVTAGAIDIIGAAAYDTNNIANVYFRDAKVCSIVAGLPTFKK